MPAETSQTLDRGLRVLEVLSDHPSGMKVSELAATLGISRTIVYRLVVTLDQHGMVRRTHDGRCRLGVAALSLARQIEPMVRDAAAPALRRLAEQLGVTAHLAVVEGSEVMVVAAAEPTRSEVHVALRVGARRPVERSVAGRAAISARSLTNPPAGWVLTGRDAFHGGHAVAAPLIGVAGLEAAVGVISMSPMDADVAGPRLVAASRDVARALREPVDEPRSGGAAAPRSRGRVDLTRSNGTRIPAR